MTIPTGQQATDTTRAPAIVRPLPLCPALRHDYLLGEARLRLLWHHLGATLELGEVPWTWAAPSGARAKNKGGRSATCRA